MEVSSIIANENIQNFIKVGDNVEFENPDNVTEILNGEILKFDSK